MKRIGDKIKKYRTDLGITQQDFASRLGVTGASVSAYENGTRTPSFDVLIRIANILGVTTDDLLDRRKAGSVTVDITGLTLAQRKIIQDIVEAFLQANQNRSLPAESSHTGTAPSEVSGSVICNKPPAPGPQK